MISYLGSFLDPILSELIANTQTGYRSVWCIYSAFADQFKHHGKFLASVNHYRTSF